MTTTDQTPEPDVRASKRWSIGDEPADVTRFTLTDPEAQKYRLEFSSPEPLLKLSRTPDGKVHAEYDPDNVTAAAQALINELARIQQPIPLPAPTTDQFAAIEARVDAATMGPWEALTDPGDRKTAPAWIVDADEIEVRLPATYRAGKVAEFIAHARTDVPALLALAREQAAKLDAVKDLADYWERTPALRRVSAASKLRAALTATEGA